MLDTVTDLGIPRKVLTKAHQLGVHNDCLVSLKPCKGCEENIFLAFDFYYSHCENEHELIRAIIDDFVEEMNQE